MKKLINGAETVLTESLDGFAAAHADIVALGDERKFVRRATLKPGKVALISGGGSGHEPLHAGFVGHGMLDAACPGQVFTSPTPDQMLAAAAGGRHRRRRALHRQELRRRRDELRDGRRDGRRRRSRTVITNDDVAVENSTWTTGRRGVAGTLVVEKIVGAAAEAGVDLAALKALGDARQRAHPLDGRGADLLHRAGRRQADLRRSATTRWRSASASTASPAAAAYKLQPADAIAEEMLGAIAADLGADAGKQALLLRQRLRRHAADGALPDVQRRPRACSRRRGVTRRPLAGRQLRHLARHGRLLDHGDPARRRGPRLWDAPVHTAALRWGM